MSEYASQPAPETERLAQNIEAGRRLLGVLISEYERPDSLLPRGIWFGSDGSSDLSRGASAALINDPERPHVRYKLGVMMREDGQPVGQLGMTVRSGNRIASSLILNLADGDPTYEEGKRDITQSHVEQRLAEPLLLDQLGERITEVLEASRVATLPPAPISRKIGRLFKRKDG